MTLLTINWSEVKVRRYLFAVRTHLHKDDDGNTAELVTKLVVIPLGWGQNCLWGELEIDSTVLPAKWDKNWNNL